MKLPGSEGESSRIEPRDLIARFVEIAGGGLRRILELLAESASSHAPNVADELRALAGEAAFLELAEVVELAGRAEAAARRIPDEPTAVGACTRAVRALARALAALGGSGRSGVRRAPTPAPLVRGHVLLVDDSKLTSDLVAAVLGDAGFAVELARDAAGLERALAAVRPDIVLSDVHMPDLDCARVLQRVREVAPEVRLLLISADGEPALARECRRVGA
ncbi:MAG TPA: response regulator, partial [Kofleriaceae bacterium]|nr:response regulator [Kofleriaceae bacterium]